MGRRKKEEQLSLFETDAPVKTKKPKKEKAPKKNPLVRYDDTPRKLSFDRFLALTLQDYSFQLSPYADIVLLGFERKKELEHDFFCPCLPGQTRLCPTDECKQEAMTNKTCYCGCFELNEHTSE